MKERRKAKKDMTKNKNPILGLKSNIPGESISDEPYQRLCRAILKQGALDLELCYIADDDEGAEKLENWFLSPWGQWLSNDMGQAIIDRTREHAVKRKKELGL